jgi:hypothetical protein
VSFLLVMLAASYAILVPLAVAEEFFPPMSAGDGPTPVQDFGFAATVLFASVAVPLLETAAFQWAPIRLLRALGNVPLPACVLVSAVAFALGHTYSFGYVLFAFLVGLVLAYCYALCLSVQRSPFFVTAVLHALRNLLTTAIVTVGANAS